MATMGAIGRLMLRKLFTASPPRWLSTVAPTASVAEQPRPEKGILFYTKARMSSTSSIADILNEWMSQGEEIRRSHIVTLSRYFSKCKNFDAALQLYDWMESSSIQINNSDHAIRIDLLFRSGGVASAEKYFKCLHASEKTNKTYGALLGCYRKGRVFDKALDLFEEMKDLNQISTVNYNSMASLCLAMGEPGKVVSLVQEMEAKNIALDLYSYNLLINGYAALHDLHAVEGVLEKMRSNNVECDVFTFGNLATVYWNSGLHDKARGYLEMIEKMEKQKSEIYEACHTCIRLYSEMNDLSGVNRAWESLTSAFRTPSLTSYLFMLLALSKLGEQESLEKLFKEWENGCSTYDFRLPNVLLSYYLGQNMIEKATSLIESLVNREDVPNLKILNAFAILCIKKGQIDLALNYLEKGLDSPKYQKWFPTKEAIRLFANYFVENNDGERAKKFVESMRKVSRKVPNSLLKVSDGKANISFE